MSLCAPLVSDPSASAGDTDSIPGPGRSQDTQARAQLLSLHSRAHEPQLLSLCAATAEARAPEHGAPQQAKSPKCETHTSQLESNPCSLQLEKEPAGSNEGPAQAKINK